MRAERMLVKQEHPAGTLPKLVGDRAPHNELLALGHKACREIGAIRWARAGHDLGPFEPMIFISIPMSLQVTTKPPSANPGVNCETEHFASWGVVYTFDAMIIAKGLQIDPVPQQEMFNGEAKRARRWWQIWRHA
jgi:hypothetical protein